MAIHEEICEAAYQGDNEALGALLKSDAQSINQYFTDCTALHLAAIGGHLVCVQALLAAKADPCARTLVPCDKDPDSGETALDKAVKHAKQREESKAEYDSIAAQLRKAEQAAPPRPKAEPKSRKKSKEAAAKASPKSRPAASPKASPKLAPAPAPAGPPLPLALLFPGQGSQSVGMLDRCKDDPQIREMLSQAREILGYDLLDLCLTGPEAKLEETRFCQPAMFLGGMAGLELLRKQRPEAVERCQAVAGLSLGEYTALCAAGVLSFEDGLRLVKLRGEAMQEASKVCKQAMISVAGLDEKKLSELCRQAAASGGAGGVCCIANHLFPKGFSCSGTEESVKALKDLAENNGALQARMLKITGAFHTALMEPAKEKLEAAIAEALPRMQPPRCPIYLNVTGTVFPAGTSPADLVEKLPRQMVSPVLWEPSVRAMMKDGISEFYECGPMKQLKAMMKRIDREVWNKTTNVEV
jgi:[acyl-carrier-protein] S-malonyltransferase